MSRVLRFLVAALLAMVVTGPVALAAAAPTGWQSVDVTLHTEEKQSVLMVSGDLPSSAKLPSEVDLAVPAGTELRWIGEILGGPSAEDPALKYVKSTVNGSDIYRVTLTDSRTAQIEGTVQSAGGADGANILSTLKWTAWQAVPVVHISTRVPAEARIVQVAPGAVLESSGSDFGYYTKTVEGVKAGDVIDLTFSYAVPALPPVAGAAATTSDTSTLLIVLAVLLGGFGIMAVAVSRRMGTKKSAREAGEGTAPETVLPAGDGSDQSLDTAPAPSRKVSPALAILAITGVLGIGVAVAVSLGTSTPVVNGKMTKFFGAASPCSSASVPVVANEGVDLASQGMKLIDAFAGQQNIGDVTLDLARSTVDVTFCESSHSEASVRQILLDTGLVTVGTAPAATASETVAPGLPSAP